MDFVLIPYLQLEGARAVFFGITVYDRSAEVISFCKARAEYRCEVGGCTHPLFEKPDGSPYVEVHYLTLLADDGLDNIDNVACLCPSHHRELHYGVMAASLLQELRELRTQDLERDAVIGTSKGPEPLHPKGGPRTTGIHPK